MSDKPLRKSIITVLGKDAVGIIAKVCSYLASNNINILDIDSQTVFAHTSSPSVSMLLILFLQFILGLRGMVFPWFLLQHV